MDKQVTLKLLLVDDGSIDNSSEVIQKEMQTKDWVSLRILLGNFGHQAALIAGLSAVDEWADVVVTMDSDLEHPTDKVIEMLQVYENQPRCVLVQGIRRPHKNLKLRKKVLSKIFYYFISLMTGIKLKFGQGDFCLWDAKLIRSLKPYLNSIGSLRVFAAWVPGIKSFVNYEQDFRANESSRYTFIQNWNLTLNSVVRFSNTPLRLITILGFLGVAVSIGHLGQIALSVYNHEPLQPGWTTLIVTIIFMSCLQLICLGILASYIRRLIFGKDLPLFLTRDDYFKK